MGPMPWTSCAVRLPTISSTSAAWQPILPPQPRANLTRRRHEPFTPRIPSRLWPERGGAAVSAQLAEPRLCESAGAEAAAGGHVQSRRRRAVEFLAGGRRLGIHVEREPDAAGAVQEQDVDAAR